MLNVERNTGICVVGRVGRTKKLCGIILECSSAWTRKDMHCLIKKQLQSCVVGISRQSICKKYKSNYSEQWLKQKQSASLPLDVVWGNCREKQSKSKSLL